MTEDNIFRLIPSIDKLLGERWLSGYLEEYDRDFVKAILNETLDALRQDVSSHDMDKTALKQKIGEIEARFKSLFDEAVGDYMKHVINCAGIVIHTNLGRAPLPAAALEKALELGTRYVNLEFDLEKGERSSRNNILDKNIQRLFPGYQSVVVNNNAAAVMLVLNTFAFKKEVVVSRGELVEIGGSFRIPEVMAKSGAILKEVGTTNKTRLSDYAGAINDKTGLLMTVHPSNYKITGFAESVRPDELVPLSNEKKIPLYHDMGSGNMFPPGEITIAEEPNIKKLTESGIPLISFSGDKLLGGCQAGIIIGKPELIDKIRKNQLLRALRADKLTYIIFSELMKLFITGKYRSSLPVYSMLSQTKEELRGRTERLREAIKNPEITLEIIEGDSFAGGGTAPTEPIPTVLLSLKHKKFTAAEFAKRLRASDPPVIARIENGRVILDLRTVFPDEEDMLISILNKI
jgi:L-seryl-tRNA(Ser) seleniumtransferase